ncbi:hypothetical protein [Metallosphaera sedula]|uniref:hypothetical protein n=1 Tax=Metallosphaera sedula TaxID=43687 RepID=UPI0020C11EF6|nr:hypothetical protein [Metallosphaera sedula]BBL47045.1 hypothetical protein MJ1HA_1146 [Metallosphaera sedula]
MENEYPSNFEFWANVNRDPQITSAFESIERAFESFRIKLEDLGFRYIYIDKYPFDERSIVLVFGEHPEDEDRNYFSIGFENITPDLNNTLNNRRIHFQTRITWWQGSRIPTSNSFITNVVFNGSNGASCGEKEAELNVSYEFYYKILVECYTMVETNLGENGPNLPHIEL